MDQVGKVIATNDGMARLEVKRVSSCGTSCASCSAACDQPPEKIDIRNSLNVKEGDYVEIKTDSSKILKYILILYGLPLLGLILGIILGTLIFNNELYAFGLGVVFLIVSGFILNRIDKRSNLRSSDVSYMVKKL